jgi:hypothetical protein
VSRFLFLGHGFFLSLVMVLPLMRNAWDPWAQTLVLGAWAFWILLGGVLVWRRGARFPPLENALRTRGPLWGAILALGLISMVFSVYPHSAVPGALGDFSTAAFFFLGAGLSREKRPLYRRALAGAGALAGVAALVLNGVRSPAVGVAVNPNALAALALLALSRGGRFVARSVGGKDARGLGLGRRFAVLVITVALSRSLWSAGRVGSANLFPLVRA